MTTFRAHVAQLFGCVNTILKWLPAIFAVVACLVLVSPASKAQITAVTTDQAPPVPGAGHDYIHFLNETVNPASGSVSIRIQAPIPADISLKIPFAFGYDSNAAHHYVIEFSNSPWTDNAAYLSQGGWNYELPSLQFNLAVYSAGVGEICDLYDNYIVTDANGTPHQPLIAIPPPASCGSNTQWPTEVLTDGDGTISATTTFPSVSENNQPPPPLTVTDIDGTVYQFLNSGSGLHMAGTDSGRDTTSFNYGAGPNTTLPNFVEDRNGNKVTITDNGAGKISITDDIGRQVLTTSGFGLTGDSVSVAGLGAPYKTTWENEPYSFSITTDTLASTQITSLTTSSGTCGTGTSTSVVGTGTISGSQPELTSLALPNGQSYTFQYDPVYGELSKIIYPTGAYVRYAWGLTSTYAATTLWQPYPTGGLSILPWDATCETVTPSVVVQHRYVSFDGVHEVLQQDFSYSTTFSQTFPGGESSPYEAWNQKQTIVTTHDLLRGTAYTTTYNYNAAIVPGTQNTYSSEAYTGVFNSLPVELSVQTTDLNGNLISYKNETYADVYLPPTDVKTTITAGNGTTGMTSEIQKTYLNESSPQTLNPLTDTYTYDFGALASVTTQSGPFGTIPQPTTSGSLLQHVHTDYASIPQTPVGGSIVDRPADVITYNGAGTRVAETDYTYDIPALTQVAAAGHDDSNFPASYKTRGNATTVTQQCFSGSQSCANLQEQYSYFQTGQPMTMTDGNGNQTQYSFLDSFTSTPAYMNASLTGAGPSSNTNGYLTQITHPSTNGVSHIEKYAYFYPDGQLSSLLDENSQPTMYAYNDPWGRLTGTGYPDTGQTTSAYNDSVPSVMTSRLLNSSSVWETTVSTMDGVGHVIQSQLTTDPYGTDNTFTSYDGEGRVYQSSNPTRCNLTTANWTTGSCSESTWGYTTNYYDALGRTIQESEQNGNILQSCYNGIANYPGLTIYCSASRLGSVATGSWVDSTDEGGNHWQRVSDAASRLTELMEPNGTAKTASMETDYSFDGLSNLLSVTQWGGASGSGGARVRSFTYDSLSRLLCASNPENSTASCPTSGAITYVPGTTGYAYDANGNLTSKTSLAVNSTTAGQTQTLGYCYDALNRMTYKFYSGTFSCTSPSGTAAFYKYDTATLPGASNDVGRLTGEGAYVNGTLTAVRTPFQYDPMGRLTYEQQIPNNQNAQQYWFLYSYDLAGDLTCTNNGFATDTSTSTCASYTALANSISTTYTYDAAQRLSTLTSGNYCASPPCSPFAQTALYTATNYGPAGILGATYGNGLQLSQAYDQRMRVVDHQIYSPSETQASGSITVSGALTSGDTGTVKITLGGVELSVPYGATTYSTQTAIADEFITLINQSPEVIATCPNTPCWAKVTAGTATTSSSGVTIPLTAILEGSTGNVAITESVTDSISVDTPSFSMAESGSALTGGSGSDAYYYQLAYKANGNINSSNDSLNSYYQYEYDTLNRVTEAAGNAQGLVINGTAYDVECWTYDAFGNRLQEAVQSPSCTTQTPGPSNYITNFNLSTGNNNQIASTSGSGRAAAYTYDVAGNVINDGVNLYVYDLDGRICAVQNIAAETGTQYVYDSEGRRVAKGSLGNAYWPVQGATCAAPTAANGFTLTNIYLRGENGDQDTELNGSGGWVHTNVSASGGLTATYWNNAGTSELSYIYSDWLGSKRAQYSSTGSLQTYWQSDPFGDYMTTHSTGGDATEHHFTGKERDTESGLDYFGARYYASSMGRFSSPDPSGLAYASLANPQSLNLYSYAWNNPLINIDPSGMECVWDDGSYDAADDAQTGNAAGCSGQGGTYVNPDLFENALLTNGQNANIQYGSWSGSANSTIASSWTTASATSSFQYDASWASAYFNAWAGGQLPTSIAYGQNDPATLAMINRPYVQNQLAAYKAAGCPATGTKAGQGSGAAYLETAGGVASGNPNYVQAEVGGYSGSITTSGGVTTVTLSNVSGISSLSGYSAGVGAINSTTGSHFNRNAIDSHNGAGQNVTQTFTQTMPSPCGGG